MTTNRLLYLEKNMYLKFFVQVEFVFKQSKIYCISHSGYNNIVPPMSNSPTFCSKNHELVPFVIIDDDFYLPLKCFKEMMEKTTNFKN